MSQEIILRKRERDGIRACTVYNISRPSYKFTFETCDNIEAIIKDSRGQIIAVLRQDSPTVVISKVGGYNICIEGIGLGIIYAEYISSSEDTSGCCEEVRNQITEINNRLNNRTITAGAGIYVSKSGDNYTITNTSPNSDTNTVTTLVPGNGVTITDSGTGGNHVYTISSSGSSGGGGGDEEIDIVSNSPNITITVRTI